MRRAAGPTLARRVARLLSQNRSQAERGEEGGGVLAKTPCVSDRIVEEVGEAAKKVRNGRNSSFFLVALRRKNVPLSVATLTRGNVNKTAPGGSTLINPAER